MSVWKQLLGWLDPAATLPDEPFSLSDQDDPSPGDDQRAAMLADAQLRTETLLIRIDRLKGNVPQGKEALEETGDLVESLDENLERLRKLFRLPENKDFIVREFTIATQPPTRAAILFLDGLTDRIGTNSHILEPLMLLGNLEEERPFSVDLVQQRLLPGHQASEKHDIASVAEAILMGDTVILMDGTRTALVVETKAPPVRSVDEPKGERVIMGPHDAFNEAFRVNTALVRRRLKDPRLVTEILTVGEVSKTLVGVMYLDTIAPPKLVEEVKRRISAVKVDILPSANHLEQYIEDHPRSLMPSCLLTERPDRAAAYLAEGHVIILIDTAPYALVCPTTFWSLLQTAEDYYLRWPFGSFLRYVRALAMLVALTLPAFYIGLINFHPEMIPTELMLFIASTREYIPMPAALELIGLDLVFELVREAGTRIPGLIGPTIGLVASLLLGQAAVEAKIVSPLMILVVALTGLASFAISNYLVAWGVTLARLLLVLAAASLGFYGLATGLFLFVVLLSAQRSFGLPFLTPIAPGRGKVQDVFNRPQVFAMEKRPAYMHPLNRRRQKEIVRPWDPSRGKQGQGGRGGGQ